MSVEQILEQLWEQYIAITPSAERIHALFAQHGEVIENDHIAIRTFNDKRVNIDVLEKLFVEAGYQIIDEYHFDQKKLFARHYQHSTNAKAPKIFISELKLELCSIKLQQIITEMLDDCDQSVFLHNRLLFMGRVWGAASYRIYETLRAESEYAAWMHVYGFCANHFTVSVNALSNFKTLQSVNIFLEKNGYKLNTSGGAIKGTPDQLLEQSSTLADMMDTAFLDGIYKIPTCYYEFALRHTDTAGQLYEGFIASSADKIFESTDFKLQLL